MLRVEEGRRLLIGDVTAGNAEDVDAACEAAARAFAEWRELSGQARKTLLHRVADAIEARAHDISLVESYDSGQPLRFMGKAAIVLSLDGSLVERLGR